jgi:hypothetical protein
LVARIVLLDDPDLGCGEMKGLGCLVPDRGEVTEETQVLTLVLTVVPLEQLEVAKGGNVICRQGKGKNTTSHK